MGIQKITGPEYYQWLAELKDKIRTRQLNAALKVNSEMVGLYWDLGKAITEKVADSNWGEKIISQLAIDLKSEFKAYNGLSRSNLFYICKFYRFYTTNSKLVQQPVGLNTSDPTTLFVQQAVGLFPPVLGFIPWGHHIQIFTKCKYVEEALFYVKQTATHNWARSLLTYHIDTDLYNRKGKVDNNFQTTLPKPQSDLAYDLLKNAYNFEFLMLSKDASERELENALINNLKKFLQELGHDFGFIGQQYHLQVSDQDYYIDLLFYHTALHCYFVIELKVNAFKPEHAGKMEFYITAVDKQLKKEGDNPTIGLLLCKDVDKIIVEYTLLSKSKPMGVAKYKYTHVVPDEWKEFLPNEDAIKEEFSKQIVLPVKPIDEKMKRLKGLLEKITTEEADLQKTQDIIRDIFSNILQVLIELIKGKLIELEPLFNTITVDKWYNGKCHGANMTETDLENFLSKERDIWSLGIQFQLDGFKKGGIKAFNVGHRVEISLHKYKYSIGLGTGTIWDERVYRQLHTIKELEVFAEKYIEKILDDINERVEMLLKPL
jgi:predicted nuclease of restriction endonuclease-like (RecB) superfamily